MTQETLTLFVLVREDLPALASHEVTNLVARLAAQTMATVNDPEHVDLDDPGLTTWREDPQIRVLGANSDPDMGRYQRRAQAENLISGVHAIEAPGHVLGLPAALAILAPSNWIDDLHLGVSEEEEQGLETGQGHYPHPCPYVAPDHKVAHVWVRDLVRTARSGQIPQGMLDKAWKWLCG